jgi:hypothetical protein
MRDGGWDFDYVFVEIFELKRNEMKYITLD